MRADLLENAGNTYTHLINKVEELYDVPSYSNLDILKKERMDFVLVWDRLERMVWFYNDEIQKVPNDNPYEEEQM